MIKRIGLFTAILAVLLLSFYIISCSPAPGSSGGGGSSTGASSSTAPLYDYYVATNGSDANPGSLAYPFRTITHAIQTAGTSNSIKVSPGTYDSAGGEIFPIVLKTGQTLIGDPANKGAGANPTIIEGTNNYSLCGGHFTALYISNSSIVIGFSLGTKGWLVGGFAICISNANAIIASNTFISPSYGGVFALGPGINYIAYNTFDGTSSYGIYLDDISGGSALIEYNTILTATLPMNFNNSTGSIIVRNNLIASSGFCGIQLGISNVLISNNIFSNLSGYLYGGVDNSGSPKIRNNIFVCMYNAVVMRESSIGIPDIGTAADYGNNDFSAVASNAVSMWSNTHITNYAVGNVWKHTPPTSNDIFFDPNCTGRVYYGPNPADWLGQ